MTIEAWNALKRGDMVQTDNSTFVVGKTYESSKPANNIELHRVAYIEDERVVGSKAFLTRDAKGYYDCGRAIFDTVRFESGESFWGNPDGFVARLKRAYQAFLKEFGGGAR